MKEQVFDIIPGGMHSDTVETALGDAHHQEVINYRQVKRHQWQSVEGYIEAITGRSDIRAAIEVTEDQSGSKCILFQEGYGSSCLKRVDWNVSLGYSDFRTLEEYAGYNNSCTITTLTLPIGVTIGDVDLHFSYHQGTVRIAGGSHPLWYSYVDKEILSASWCQLDVANFESTTEGFTGYNATIARSDSISAYQNDYFLSITQTDTNGAARISYNWLVSGKQYKVKVRFYHLTDGNVYNTKLMCGTSAGGDQYGYDRSTVREVWTELSVEFTATSTNLYVDLIPGEFLNDKTIFFDMYVLEEEARTEITGWKLLKAEVTDYPSYSVSSKTFTLDEGTAGGTDYNYYYAIFFIFDNGQYSLPVPISYQDLKIDSDEYLAYARQVQVKISQLEYLTNSIGARVTGCGLLVARSTDYLDSSDPTMTWYVADVQDLVANMDTDKIEKKTFSLYLYQTGVYASPSYSTDVLKLINNGLTVGQEYLNSDSAKMELLASHIPILAHAAKGRRVIVSGESGSVETRFKEEEGYTGIPNPGSYPNFYTCEFFFEDDITSVVPGTTPYNFTLQIFNEPTMEYASGRSYIFTLAVDCNDMPSITYNSYTGIPLGTTQTNPDYSQHAIADGRGYCNSSEEDEEGIARYSPPNQPDVFPQTFLIPVEVGSSDYLKAIIERDNRMVMLTRDSISQVQYSGSSYKTDIALAENGLFADKGFLVIDHELYYMGKQELYLFTGGKPRPLLSDERIRQAYVEKVTPSSFILWNKQHRELWLVLYDTILVYEMDHKTWYIRETDITPVCGFVIENEELHIATSNKIVRASHEDSTFDESLRAYFKTGLKGGSRTKRMKKASSMELYCQGNADLTITLTDPLESVSSLSETITPDEDNVSLAIWRPLYLFTGIEVEVETETTNDLDVTIRKGEIEVQEFGR